MSDDQAVLQSDVGATVVCVAAAARHNLGDMLVPHVVRALAGGSPLLVASPLSRDMRALGGHRVWSYREAATICDDDFVRLIVGGGETLAAGLVDSFLAGVGPADAQSLALLRAFTPDLASAVCEELAGTPGPLAYVLPAEQVFAGMTRSEFHGVGLVDPRVLTPHSERFLLDQLDRAAHVGVRDGAGLEWLRAHGLTVRAEPSSVSMISDVPDDLVSARSDSIPVRSIRDGDDGFVAAQFGDELLARWSPDVVGEQIRTVYRATGVRTVLFAAGTSSGQDRLSSLRYLASVTDGAASVMETMNIWDICWLIKHSRGFCGSSLDARIVALSYGIPRRSVVDERLSFHDRKIRDYCEIWDDQRGSILTDASSLASSMIEMLADSPQVLFSIKEQSIAALHDCWQIEDRKDLNYNGVPDATGHDGRLLARSALLIQSLSSLRSALAASLRDTNDSKLEVPSILDVLFDAKWYEQCNPDLTFVTQSARSHYQSIGWREHRNPHPCFDVEFYLETNPDLPSELEPLSHYAEYGWREGRDPSPWFDVDWYLAVNPDVRRSGREPLSHYLSTGWTEGRAPNQCFDPVWYEAAYNEDPRDVSPLVRHVTLGVAEGRVTQPVLPVRRIASIKPGLRPGTPPAVVLHLHYAELWEEMLVALGPALERCSLYVTLTAGASERVADQVAVDVPSAHIDIVENRGRDVLPFLRGLPHLVEDGVPVALKVHGKRSPQLAIGENWRRLLLSTLVPSVGAVESIIAMFETDTRLGLAIPLTCTQPLSYHFAANREHVDRLCRRLLPVEDTSWSPGDRAVRPLVFPRGNMFWFRPAALATMAGVDVHEFPDESGQHDGTMAHALERMPALICGYQGYEVASYEVTEPSLANDLDVMQMART